MSIVLLKPYAPGCGCRYTSFEAACGTMTYPLCSAAVGFNVHIEGGLPVAAPSTLRAQQPIVLARRVLSQHNASLLQQVSDGRHAGIETSAIRNPCILRNFCCSSVLALSAGGLSCRADCGKSC